MNLSLITLDCPLKIRCRIFLSFRCFPHGAISLSYLLLNGKPFQRLVTNYFRTSWLKQQRFHFLPCSGPQGGLSKDGFLSSVPRLRDYYAFYVWLSARMAALLRPLCTALTVHCPWQLLAPCGFASLHSSG